VGVRWAGVAVGVGWAAGAVACTVRVAVGGTAAVRVAVGETVAGVFAGVGDREAVVATGVTPTVGVEARVAAAVGCAGVAVAVLLATVLHPVLSIAMMNKTAKRRSMSVFRFLCVLQ
jgi:hypothetical protein